MIKYKSFFCAILMAFAVVSSCKKQGYIETVPDEEVTDPEDTEDIDDGHLVENDPNPVAVDLAMAFVKITNTIDSLSVTVNDPRFPTLVQYLPMLENKWTGNEWRLESHHFTYNSVDAQGNPVVLTAKMFMVRNSNHAKDLPAHRCVLFCQPFIQDSDSPILQVLYYARALWGDVIVCPYHQGVGVDVGEGKYMNLSEIKLMGRQALDGQLAAMELMEKLGIKKDIDFHTECYGISNGAGTAAAVTRLVEEGNKKLQRTVKLGSSLMIEGAMNYEPLFENMLDGSSRAYGYIYATLLYSLFCSHPDLFPADTRREDLFSEWANNYRYETTDGPMHPLDAQVADTKIIGGYEKWIDIVTPKMMLNESFFDEDGKIKKDHPLYKAFIEAARRSDIVKGWDSPKTPMLFMQSKDDDMILYDTFEKQYMTLTNGGRNPNVILHTTEGKDHLLASALGMVYVMANPNPAPLWKPWFLK